MSVCFDSVSLPTTVDFLISIFIICQDGNSPNHPWICSYLDITPEEKSFHFLLYFFYFCLTRNREMKCATPVTLNTSLLHLMPCRL